MRRWEFSGPIDWYKYAHDAECTGDSGRNLKREDHGG
jgi:hypothetical protein